MSDYAQVQTPSGGGRKVVEAVVELLEPMLANSVGAIGIDVPGLAWPDGRVWAPNIPGWKRMPLGPALRKRFRLPVLVESDRNAFVVGEAWQRAARNYLGVVFLAVGTGIGAGRLGAAFLLRVLGSRRTMLLSAAITVTGAMLAFNSREFSVVVLGVSVIGLGLASIYPTALGVAGDRFPRQTGTVFGAIMAVSLVGGTAGPSICGTLAATGLRNILWVPMLSALAVAMLTILITREPPGDKSLV